MFKDEGVSGTKGPDQRPGLSAALAAAKAADVLIVVSINRLARRASLLLSLWDQLEAAGVSIVAVKESINTATPLGRLMRTMIAGIAEFERDMIVERTTTGRNERGRRDGERGGSVPYGYRRTPAGVIEVHAEEANVVRRIFRLKSKGLSLSDICRRLDDVPPQRGKQWYASAVKCVLDKRAVYRGGKRGESEVRWPKIL